MSDLVFEGKPYSHEFGKFEIRRWYAQSQDILTNETWKTSGLEYPQRKVIVGAVVKNPFSGQFENDLSSIFNNTADLGHEFGRRIVENLGGRDAESYGKACLVGLNGEYEHGNAFLTTTFANPVRAAIGEAKSWIPSTGKRGVPGTSIDIPLAHKEALYVRSHYDSITATFDDAPAPDEIVILFAVATQGRIQARLGGLTADEITGKDGLV
jgi:hypothetical protein